ncbi:LPS export ABC transporter periplasmic protein LptC [Caulobacter sp. SL161]|uniref:LPS export ABC transporter periplasmic protein LptC n=1 Tax=Caulobacter sp. SL161 TaxID=2995156 RepID=UPI002272619F|nr:LPS export ABC transporter periplasmic protein LptC [Caulobacter sp. SL161]MCY1647167.1 LPS export ABC transporter periplasmic protein LptC [Caulobacter sp. SL161]
MLTQSDGAAAILPSQTAAERARNRRRKPVRRLRLGLAVFAAGVAATVIVQAAWRSLASGKLQTQAATAPLVLDKPRFTGVLKDGRPFLITAERAERDAKDQNIVRLTAPLLVRGYGEPNPSQATAKSGVYREAENTLLLTDEVKITSAEGFDFDAPRALIDLRTGAVSGDAGIAGSGPKGSTRASAYEVTDKGDRVVLKGGVRTRLEPRH